MTTARWYHEGRLRPIRLIVFHTMESAEMGTTAESCARYFETTDRKASAHVCADSNSFVRCVDDADTAFGAAGANADGLHLEQAGRAAQTAAQWRDPYSDGVLNMAATVAAGWCRKHDIPPRWLTVAQVADGKTKGFCTHNDVSLAFPERSTGHTDPGPNYPKVELRRRVMALLEDDMFEDSDRKLLVEVTKLARLAVRGDDNPAGGDQRPEYVGLTEAYKKLDARLAAIETKLG